MTENLHTFTLDSSVECLTQRRREAESAENARNLANTMNYASNLLEAKHHLKGETTKSIEKGKARRNQGCLVRGHVEGRGLLT